MGGLLYRGVHEYPETPELDTDTASGLSGHVWIQELPTGGPVRFQVAASGLITFGTPSGTFETVASMPAPFRQAAMTIADQLDLAALRAATDEPASVTFCGIATWYEGVDYDWASLPAFVGTDVWTADRDRFLPPDTAAAAFDRLGLATLPAIEKESPAAHTDFSRFETPGGYPESAWYDGPAAAVLIRDKSGGRAVGWRPNRPEPEPIATARSSEELATAYATDERIERATAAIEVSDGDPTVGAVRDRLVAIIAREAHADLYSDGTFVGAPDAFRAGVAERVQQYRFDDE